MMVLRACGGEKGRKLFFQFLFCHLKTIYCAYFKSQDVYLLLYKSLYSSMRIVQRAAKDVEQLEDAVSVCFRNDPVFCVGCSFLDCVYLCICFRVIE